MKVMLVGIAIMAVSWLPFQIYTDNHPTAIPFDFGILSLLGVFIGGVVAVIGFVQSFIRTVREANRKGDS